MEAKRPASEVFADNYVKRIRSNTLVVADTNAGVLTESKNVSNSNAQFIRTSNLLAPIMLLEGHKGHVYGCEFNLSGQQLASCSFDNEVLIWQVFGECKSIAALKGHKGAVLQAAWNSTGERIFTASADKTCGIFDAEQGTLVKRVKNHSSFVNTCRPSNSPQLFASGGDDSMTYIGDARYRGAVVSLNCDFPVLAIDWSLDSTVLYTAGIDHAIRAWDIRKANQSFDILEGHSDSITGIHVSPDGNFLLSNSMDQTLRIWDLKPYATQRCIYSFISHQHTFEKNLLRCDWSSDGTKVSAGSSDKFVYVWDVQSRKLLYKLV